MGKSQWEIHLWSSGWDKLQYAKGWWEYFDALCFWSKNWSISSEVMSLLVKPDKAGDSFVSLLFRLSLLTGTWSGVINLLLVGTMEHISFHFSDYNCIPLGFSLQRLSEPRGSWGFQSQVEVDWFDSNIWYLIQPQALLCVIMTTFHTDIIFPLGVPSLPE